VLKYAYSLHFLGWLARHALNRRALRFQAMGWFNMISCMPASRTIAASTLCTLSSRNSGCS